MGGEAMGDWSLNVEFNETTENFPIIVEMMGSDKKTLTDTDSNQFFVFDLGRHVMGNMNEFSVYISARNTMFDYSPIDENATVEMCAADDCATSDSTSWKLAVRTNPGEYKAMELGLAGDDTDEIQVRVTESNAAETLTSDAFTFSAMNMSMGM